MFFVGIDIAKNSHEATVLDNEGNSLVKPFKSQNSSQGFNKLLSSLNAISSNILDFEFGMEATGHYWLNLYTKLIDLNAVVHVINPVQSDALRGLYIRQTKNDAKDAFIIAELIRFGRYSETSLSDSDLLSLRELTRQRFYLIDCASDAKRKVISFIDKVSPEYQNVFSDIFGVTSMELLATYTSPDVIADLNTDLSPNFLNQFLTDDLVKPKLKNCRLLQKTLLVHFCL